MCQKKAKQLHATGCCQPCRYYFGPGHHCSKGADCNYCHDPSHHYDADIAERVRDRKEVDVAELHRANKCIPCKFLIERGYCNRFNCTYCHEPIHQACNTALSCVDAVLKHASWMDTAAPRTG